jgi:NAD(P)-dependent dehydrogenase (short-subunit alcohol dehydrogenase family)
MVTGASSGIGEATARLLAGAGARVIVLARSTDKLDALVQSIRQQGGQVHAYRLDLYRTPDVAPLVQQIEREHGRIDILVSNAGKSIRRGVLASARRQDLERSLAVNFTSPAALITALLPGMVARGGGQIVNVSSLAVKTPGAPRWAAYQSSKAGFDLWLGSVAAELASSGVTAASIYLPLVHTPMSAATPLYTHLPGLTPLEAAQCVAHALVYRSVRAAPWWLFWTELAALLWPAALRRVLSWSERVTLAFERLASRTAGRRRP